jgi:hypothetical protein
VTGYTITFLSINVIISPGAGALFAKKSQSMVLEAGQLRRELRP